MMKRFFLCSFFSILIFMNCSTERLNLNAIFVSDQGNDSWSGLLSEPNLDKTDGPFLTLDRAKKEVRKMKNEKNIEGDGITVYIREGIYSLDESFKLNVKDAGVENGQIVWRNYPGEKVRLIGGTEINGFTKITDPEILKKIDKKYQDKIYQIDLKSLGIENYGEITRRGAPGLELFYENNRMQIARYPNNDWLKVADVPQYGAKLLNKGLDREKRYDGVPVGRHYGKISYNDDRFNHWSNPEEVFLHGYWTWDWSDSYQKIKSIDKKKKEIIFAEPHHHYGYTKNQRFYALNILEELDTPGEWYLDRQSGMLYFWPPEEDFSGTAFVSILAKPLIEIVDCTYLKIQGLHLEYSRGSGVVVNGGSNIEIAGCQLQYLGDNAIEINGGRKNGVQSCDISDVAMNGIMLRGGDRKTLTSGENYAVNNHIHHYSYWIRTGQFAINIQGVGNHVAHNLIHDAPHEGMYVRGNEHLLEYNEIYNVCYETGDAGAIHTGRNYTWRGNTYRYNYFHHLKGPGLHGVTAIYLDDFTSGFNIYGNICYKSGRGTLIGGGRDNVIENNVYIECFPSIVLDGRGLGWASYYFDGTYPVLFDSLKSMNATEPPYSEKYPELITVANDEPAVPKNNKIIHNISYGGRFIELYDFFAYDFSVNTIKDNLIADPIVCKRIKEDPKGWEPYYLNLDVEAGYINFENNPDQIPDELAGNQIIDSDPGFVDLKNMNFQLKKDSPAFELGFKRIPVEKIGLYKDEFRKLLEK